MDGSLPSFEERGLYEKVRTAKALEKLPLVSAAMERGEISYSKVRAITRVATPENEHYFLQIALHGTAHHVETLVRAYRRATEAEELSREHQQQMKRGVQYQWDDDGSLILKARLPADVGAVVLKALDLAIPETSSPQRPDPRTYTDGLIPPDCPAVSAETARRLACDASLVAIVEKEKGEPLSVGRHPGWRLYGLRDGDGLPDELPRTFVKG